MNIDAPMMGYTNCELEVPFIDLSQQHVPTTNFEASNRGVEGDVSRFDVGGRAMAAGRRRG